MLRIAFDLDGVLADMDGELAHHAEALFGESAVRARQESEAEAAGEATAESGDASAAEETPPPAKLATNARQTDRLWQHVQSIENFWETLREFEPGTLARLAALAAERRWEIIFLTRRPATAGATSQVQTQRWLEARGFPLPSVFVVQNSRGRIASALALDVVVDDRPENCLDVVVDSKARAILVWRDDQQEVPAAANRLGIGVVKSVAECLDVLTGFDAASRQQPGLMSRVKKALGLNETAGT